MVGLVLCFFNIIIYDRKVTIKSMKKYEEINIINIISKGKNVLFYDENVYYYFDEIRGYHDCIFFNEPVPIKNQLISIINKFLDRKKQSLNRLTIPELLEKLVSLLGHKIFVIMFNNFEKLTKRPVAAYQQLNSLKNIVFVCSFKNNFKKDAYYFFKTFEFVNKKKYEKETGKNEINITYGLYFILTSICFAVYIKLMISLYNEAPGLLISMLGAIWFSFLIFRTFSYAGGKI